MYFNFDHNNIKLICNTWTKDAHALFDYETDNINKINVPLSKGGKLIRKEEINTVNYDTARSNSLESKI